jgi:hypothetical protein
MDKSQFQIAVTFERPIAPTKTLPEAEYEIRLALEEAVRKLWPGLAIHAIAVESGAGISEAQKERAARWIFEHEYPEGCELRDGLTHDEIWRVERDSYLEDADSLLRSLSAVSVEEAGK